MFLVERNGDAAILQYDLSTPWDISTATYVAELNIRANVRIPRAVWVAPDAVRVFAAGTPSDDPNTVGAPAHVFKFHMATPGDISTGVHVESADFDLFDDFSDRIELKVDGTKLFMFGVNSNGKVGAWNLDPPWDLKALMGDRGLFPDETFDTSAQDKLPVNGSFKPDGTKMFLLGVENDLVYEYDLPTPWDVGTASFVQSFDPTADGVGNFPQALDFKPDGAKMFIADQVGEDIYEWALSTPWDVSTATLNTTLDVSGQIGPSDLLGMSFQKAATGTAITTPCPIVANAVLQSPSYDGTGGNGTQIPLSVAVGRHQGQGLVDILQFFAGIKVGIDLGKLKEGIQLQAALTDAVAACVRVREDGDFYASALALREAIRRTRTEWPQEDAPAAGQSAQWDDAGLPSDEQDAGTDRAPGKVRLIFDVEDDDNDGVYGKFFLYGFVQQFMHQQAAPTQRERILASATFVPASLVVALGGA